MKPQSCAFVAGILGAIAGLLPGQSATSRSEDQPVVKVIHDLVRARLGSKLVEWADMIPAKPAPSAQWCRFRATGSWPPSPSTLRRRPEPVDFGGWLLWRRDRRIRVIDWFGAETECPEDALTIQVDSLRAAADRLLLMHVGFERATLFDSDETTLTSIERHEEAFRIMRQCGLRRKVVVGYHDNRGPRWEGSVPDALVSAWSFLKGDPGPAADLLLPLLQNRDPKQLWDTIRDGLASRWDNEMLRSLTIDRDYDRALYFAGVLAGRAYDGCTLRARAIALASELEHRSDDFLATTLPTEGQWASLGMSLTRNEHIEYLLRRIRLINLVELDPSTGLNYADKQYRASFARVAEDPTGEGRQYVINPARKLRFLLDREGCVRLIPALESTEHILAFSTFRLGGYPCDLHRVAWVARDIINRLAGKQLLTREMSDAETVAAVKAWSVTSR